MFTMRFRASTFQILSARLSKNDTMVTFALDTSLPRHTSTSCFWRLPRLASASAVLFLDALLPPGVGGSEVGAACGVGFARSLLSCRKLHLSPFEHWPFLFPLVANTFSSFNAYSSLSILQHCSCFNFLMSGVKVS